MNEREKREREEERRELLSRVQRGQATREELHAHQHGLSGRERVVYDYQHGMGETNEERRKITKAFQEGKSRF